MEGLARCCRIDGDKKTLGLGDREITSSLRPAFADDVFGPKFGKPYRKLSTGDREKIHKAMRFCEYPDRSYRDLTGLVHSAFAPGKRAFLERTGRFGDLSSFSGVAALNSAKRLRDAKRDRADRLSALDEFNLPGGGSPRLTSETANKLIQSSRSETLIQSIPESELNALYKDVRFGSWELRFGDRIDPEENIKLTRNGDIFYWQANKWRIIQGVSERFKKPDCTDPTVKIFANIDPTQRITRELLWERYRDILSSIHGELCSFGAAIDDSKQLDSVRYELFYNGLSFDRQLNPKYGEITNADFVIGVAQGFFMYDTASNPQSGDVKYSSPTIYGVTGNDGARGSTYLDRLYSPNYAGHLDDETYNALQRAYRGFPQFSFQDAIRVAARRNRRASVANKIERDKERAFWKKAFIGFIGYIGSRQGGPRCADPLSADCIEDVPIILVK